MKVVLQRVSSAQLEIDSKCVAAIDRGLVLLCGFGQEDEKNDLVWMATKVCNLRVFPDESGRFHFSVKDIEGGVLAVPQFTLYADTKKGRRPEFFSAMKPERATEFFDDFVKQLHLAGQGKVEQGVFAADMQVTLVNDGPVTICLDSIDR